MSVKIGDVQNSMKTKMKVIKYYSYGSAIGKIQMRWNSNSSSEIENSSITNA